MSEILINEFRAGENRVQCGEHDLYQKLWRELEAFGDDPSDRTPIVLGLETMSEVSSLDEVVYQLSRANSIALKTMSLGVIWVTRSSGTFADVSRSSRSSFRPVRIEFSRYGESDLREILRYRAGVAFRETTTTRSGDGYEVESDVLSEGVLDRVAEIAAGEYGGDAEEALALLREAGRAAQETDDGVVTVEDVVEAHNAIC